MIYNLFRGIILGSVISMILLLIYLLIRGSPLNYKKLLASFISVLFGSWFYLYFASPSQVGIFWFFIVFITILMIVLLSKISSFSNISKIILFTSPLIILLFWYFPLFIGISFMFSVLFQEKNTKYNYLFAIILTLVLIMSSVIGISLVIYKPVDNGRYFDSLITYDDGLPFRSTVDGSDLRVVDIDLAQSIMLKSNLLGSNTKITDIHLGKINGSTYWIGAVSFSGSKVLRQDLNYYQGFIGVDFLDPQKPPIHITQKFYAGTELTFNRNIKKIIHNYNLNYLPGDNSYFTMTSDGDMRLIVPYSYQTAVMFGGIPNAGIITQGIQKIGGVLEINSKGEIIHDYKNLEKLPDYAIVQFYSEDWLEREVRYWGRTIVDIKNRDFSALAYFGGIFKSKYLMGIDDDTRVIVDPDTGNDVQIVMLDSTGSENQILRGAIKANQTGIYYYDWSEYGFIDTNTAHEHGETALTNYFGNTVHGYNTLMPILYPVINNPTDMNDYAYIMPLQFRETRFGGIIITDPSDKTGAHTVVKVAEGDHVNISLLLQEARNEYIETGSTTTISGNFKISAINSYVQSGDTVYVITGNFTDLNETYTVVFSQEWITNLKEWLLVVKAQVGDTFFINIQLSNGVYYATSINEV